MFTTLYGIITGPLSAYYWCSSIICVRGVVQTTNDIMICHSGGAAVHCIGGL